MKDCPRCSAMHNKPGIYCSRKCANVRSWSEETNEKRRKKLLQWSQSDLNKENLQKAKVRSKQVNEQRWREIRSKTDTTNLGRVGIRKKVLNEQGGKCNCCSLDKWLEQDMPFELNHIDGNNTNNKRENLEMLCPNCHALTPTWRGRNNNFNINSWKSNYTRVV